MNWRLLYNMTHRDNVDPVGSLKFVTLLVALIPELLFLGAGVKLQDNGYDGLLIAINPQVSEDQNLIPNIKEMITEASFYLFNATKRRVFFRNIKILIPATWKANNYSKVKQELYEKANVIVTDWYGAHGDDPYTLQYRGCGKEGKYIHFTSNFLLNDDLTAGYGPRGRVFVHEWAHLRWGLFDEYNDEKPFYINGQNQVKVTRCSSDIAGIFVCEKGPCPQENCIISKLFKEGCMFIYNSTQNATASIMFMQSLSSVVEFCNARTHNQEAPNLQNQMCSLRSAWDVITDSADFNHSFPMNGTQLPPPPVFSLIQPGDKVVCLVLDVSSKMAEANRLLRLQQAVEFYLMQIVEIHTFVGIVSFNSKGEIRAQLHQINSDDDRKLLVSHLPMTVSAEAETSVCSGLKKGFEVVEKLNGKAYGSVMILVTSGDDEHIDNCLLTALSSGSTIHSIAMGSSVVENLEELSRRTGGLKFFVPDESNSNSMIDAFSRISSGTGDIFQQCIQLESTGENVKPHHQLKNTVTMDDSVGNDTTFLVTWQISGPPEILLFDPNGRKYYTNNFITNPALQTARLYIPGTAEPGLWTYTLNNTHHSLQALKMTVTSRASSSAMLPATVEAFVERDSTRFPHPVMIYANVRKGIYPILNATVTATIEPEAADPIVLKLFDNGAGNIQMNAPRKSAGRSEEEQKWGISRVSSGGSFSVLGVPAGPHPDVFPPCKITDLQAIKVEDEVTLSWTAPGEDYDQGEANSYEIRISKSLQNIQDDFNNAILVNTSKLNPQQAGTKEVFTFSPKLFTNGPDHQPDGETQESHRIYVAIRAIDKNSLKSVISNIAQASLFISPNSAPILTRDHLILKGVLTAMGSIGIICLTIVVTHCTLNRKKRADKKENGTKLI
ncbi:calcium-activated chloride channel regulator 2 isoform X2 [Canis lupus familiaris]|uniref:Calcium-activated chloride channel regulator 2 n=1 Tax=Canis lupus familiaris TaxID=9615 RepID=A0A8C0S4E0_CANLF|nr:calcium-activated chloride channel regulator 2 isoform X2 [Canis lupus familiaris]XP_038526150.1 calcium-activated chloride channel regulator 2 isoform X2 [Canis lupus familiaris]